LAVKSRSSCQKKMPRTMCSRFLLCGQ
jgi:hypothetical protein